MTRLLHLFTALFAIILVLAACGGQPTAEDGPAPTEAPAAAAPENAATDETAEESEDADESAGTTDVAGYPRTITDGQGREITLEQPPERVVALYNGNFGMLATLGIRPVATLANEEMLTDPIYFEDGESIPSVVGNDGEIDPEIVAELTPDLIMASNIEEVRIFESIAPVYLPTEDDAVTDTYDELRRVAALFAMEAEAEAAISAFQDRLAAYKARVPSDISVMITAPDGDNLGSVSLRTEVSPDCRLLNEIASCDWEDPVGSGVWAYDTTPETLLELNPDFIYFWNEWDGTQEELLAFLRQDPLWAELDAVQNEQVFHVEGYTNPIASSLPAAAKILDTFAPRIYPDIFDGPLTDAEVQEIVGSETAAGEERATTASSEDFPLTIEDGAGREITFEEPPQRVVCFSAGCIRGLGPLVPLSDTVMGLPTGGIQRHQVNNEFDDEGYYPGLAEVMVVFDAGPTLEYDAEAIAEFQPDLIIASEQNVASYESIAPVFVEYEVRSLDDAIESFLNYGRIIGMADEAEQIVQDVQDRYDAYEALAPNDATFMTVFLPDDDELVVRTNNSSECFVLEGLARCEWPDPTGGVNWAYTTSAETIVELNPDVIYLGTAGMLEEFISDPLIAETEAAQNNRIYHVEGYDSPTGNGVMAISKLLDIYMPLIYPDIFPDGPLTDAEVQEILAEQ